MKTAATVLAATLLAVATAPAQAHHSATMFDPNKEVTLEGIVKEFQWTNPHTWIQVVVANPTGGQDEWSIEGGSPNLVGRQGWKRNSFKPGDKVTMVVHPMKSGERGGSFVSATFPDGRVLGRQPTAAAAKPG